MYQPTIYSDPAQPSRAGKLDNIQKANKAGVVCRHCHQGKINRPRGLCWHCYYAPGVRELYPSTSKYARRGIGHGFNHNKPPDPSGPTRTVPGTPEKVEVLAFRAKYGYALWHEADALFANDPRVDQWFKTHDSVPRGECDVLFRQAV